MLRIARHAGIHNKIQFLHLAPGRQRQFGRHGARHQVRHAEKAFPQSDRLEVCRLESLVRQSFLQSANQVDQKFVEAERLRRREMHRHIQPAELGLSLSVDIVVNVQNSPTKIALLAQELFQPLEPGPRLRGDPQPGRARIPGGEQRIEFLHLGRRQFVDAVDQDQVRFFELLLENVRRFRRKSRPRFVLQDLPPLAGLQDDRIGRDGEFRIIQLLQGLDDRGDEVGAASDWFRQDHIRPLVPVELFDRSDQVVKLAAEAGPRDFADVESLRAEVIRIDEILGLVVRDNADLPAAPGVFAGESGDHRRLAGAEESADEHKFHLVGHPLRVVLTKEGTHSLHPVRAGGQ